VGYALQEILGFAPLTESIRLVSNEVPNPFPPEFQTVNPKNRILGDRAKYIRVTGHRQTGKFAKWGAPSRSRALYDVGDQDIRMLHEHEDITIELTVMQQLRAFEQYEQDRGMDWLNFQLTEAGKRIANSRIICTASILRYGNIYLDSDGNLLPSSSGAQLTAGNASIPATHQNQINGNISASWASNTTDIPGDIVNLKIFMKKETGMDLNTAMYGANVRKYLTQNDYVLDYLSRDGAPKGRGGGTTLIYSTQVPQGIFDIEHWHPVYTSFFEDYNGTLQEMWNADLVVWTPSISQPDKMTWWGMYEGSYPVPKRLEIMRDGRDPWANHEIEYGQFSYAIPRLDIPAYTIHMGDTFIPMLRNESAMFQSIVAF
jgi:hypothetical protein